jgi:hypothetical protein
VVNILFCEKSSFGDSLKFVFLGALALAGALFDFRRIF